MTNELSLEMKIILVISMIICYNKLMNTFLIYSPSTGKSAPCSKTVAESMRQEKEYTIPKTFPEYLEKYYGTVDKRDGLIKDDQHSDTEIDYNRQPLIDTKQRLRLVELDVMSQDFNAFDQ